MFSSKCFMVCRRRHTINDRIVMKLEIIEMVNLHFLNNTF